MDILAAKISISMSAGSASAELSEQFRVDWIFQAPDQHAFIVWLLRIAAPAGRNSFQGGDHLSILDLHLDGPGILWARDEVQHARPGRIGDVHDRPAAIPQMAHVQVPAAIALLDRQLEGRPPVDLRVTHYADIASHWTARKSPM